METVNKSGGLKAAFEKEQEEGLLGRALKLRNSPAHRWSAMEDVMGRVLKLWNHLMVAFNGQGLPFPMAEDKRVMIEFYSVLKPVRDVQKLSQKMHEFV
jgi:hypothetical protein